MVKSQKRLTNFALVKSKPNPYLRFFRKKYLPTIQLKKIVQFQRSSLMLIKSIFVKTRQIQKETVIREKERVMEKLNLIYKMLMQ